MKPTYHLQNGHPGTSAAFEIASQHGLPDEIVLHARDIYDEKATSHLEHAIAEIEKQRLMLEDVKGRTDTLIFYEAPHHLKKTLQALISVLGDARQAALGRELTKRFEEFQRGTLGELAAYYEENEPRGEYVIVVEGCGEEAAEAVEEKPQDPKALYEHYLAKGMPKKEAMRAAAKDLGISRRDIYNMLLE